MRAALFAVLLVALLATRADATLYLASDLNTSTFAEDITVCTNNTVSVNLTCVCAPGYGSAACAACTVGSFKAEAGAETCTACPTGTTTVDAASVAQADCVCLEGYTGTDCEPCAGGTYKTALGNQ